MDSSSGNSRTSRIRPPPPVSFDSDRQAKYGWGVLRLALVTYAATFLIHDATATSVWNPGWRGLWYLPFGAVGAVVNVRILPPWLNLVLLGVLAGVLLNDLRMYDAAGVVYLAKTMAGDHLTGKLDTLEWRLVGAFAAVLFSAAVAVRTAGLLGGGPLELPVSAFASEHAPGADDPNWAVPSGTLAHLSSSVREYSRIFVVLFLIQCACEYGDGKLEHVKFFRHRYSYEVLTLLVLFLYPGAGSVAGPPLTAQESTVVALDLFTCLAYRGMNFLIICIRQLGGRVARVSRMAAGPLIFWVYGKYRGLRTQYVRDPVVAAAVMRQSVCKGYGIEKYIACPAWHPVLSLESVDGKTWEAMHADFQHVMKAIPPVERLHAVARKHLQRLADQATPSSPIDSRALAKTTVAVFIEYLFDREWEDRFSVIADASWEWRKEIGIRGVADRTLKDRAIHVLVHDLLLKSDRFRGLFDFTLSSFSGEGGSGSGSLSGTGTGTGTGTGSVSTPSAVAKSPGEPRPAPHRQSSQSPWVQPRYFSLIMQPFLISPAINTGDVLVAAKSLSGSGATKAPKLEAASTPLESAPPIDALLRVAHPFPILERFVSNDVVVDGKVVVPANTQTIMFTPDWANSPHPWPVFAAGKRMCPGAALARTWLTLARDVLLPLGDAFQPALAHQFSGRDNDDRVTLAELWYFVKVIYRGVVYGDGKHADPRSTPVLD